MPLAAVAPELLAVIAVALLLVVLLVNVQLYQNGKQARSFALGLPVVAIPVVTAIDWLINFDVQAAQLIDNALESVLLGGAQALANLIVNVWNIAGAALTALIHRTATQAAQAEATATHLATVDLPKLESRVQALERLQGAVSGAIREFVQAAIVVATAPLLARLAAVEAAGAGQQQTLNTYRPLWDQLAAVPGGAAATILRTQAAVGVLQGELGKLGQQVADLGAGASALERTVASQQALLAKLSVLLTLAAAGSLAIAELARIGRNPCQPCAGLDLNDFEARIASVELLVT